MHPVLSQTDHRPLPLPKQPWVVGMRWHDLLFAHWPVRVDRLRPLIPAALEIDAFDGWAWLGIVPFRMTRVYPRYALPAPFGFAFPELNVRTYVSSGGKRGVWFFSLDAASWLSVRVARAWYGLPYYDARMNVQARGEEILYDSSRVHRGSSPAAFAADYRPTSPPFAAAADSFDAWLTERYVLFAPRRNGGVGFGEVHHAPWPLQRAEADIRQNTMSEQLGFSLAGPPAALHFTRYLDVVAWGVRTLT